MIIALRGDEVIDKFIKPMGLYDKAIFVDLLRITTNLLKTGIHDFVVAPYRIGMDTIEKNICDNIKVIGPPILLSLYRLAVKKRNIALLSQLNEGIDLVKVGPKCRELAMNGLTTGAMKNFQRAFIKYAAYAGVPVIFILFALFLWTWSLKRKVEERTRALQESEQSYHNQFANTTAMVLLDPADGAILDANAAALNFYGHPRQRLMAMRITPRPFGRSAAGHNIR